MAPKAQLLGEASEGSTHRIMIWGYPDGRMKIVWIWTTAAGHSHWRDAVFPLADLAALCRVADAYEPNRPDERSGAPHMCELSGADGTRFRAPGSLLVGALGQIPITHEAGSRKGRRAAPRRTAPDPSVSG